MIVLFDHRADIGGGQKVMVELARRLRDYEIDFRLAVPPGLAEAIDDGASLTALIASAASPVVLPDADSYVLVANTYPVILGVTLSALRLRLRGRSVSTAVVMHSYPSTWYKKIVVSLLLRLVRYHLPVEPGLMVLCRGAERMPVLGLNAASSDVIEPFDASADRVVKSFGRADPSKGLDLLPEIYRRVRTEMPDVRFEVALAPSLEGQHRYETSLRSRLTPWLVEGRRGEPWLNPGEFFLLPSRAGEAVSLTTQEALRKGLTVIAPRIGAIPFLLEGEPGLHIYEPGDPADAARACVEALSVPEERRHCEALGAQRAMNALSGKWYEAAVAFLRELDPACR